MEIEPAPADGPSRVNRIVELCTGALWFVLRWLAQLPLRFSRRLSILAFSILLLLIVNVPVVSNGLLDQVIDVVPWSGTTVQTDGLNLRASPGTGSEVRLVLEFGREVTITGLPADVNGTPWWPVMADGERGWVSGQYLDETRLMQTVQIPREARDTVGGLVGILTP